MRDESGPGSGIACGLMVHCSCLQERDILHSVKSEFVVNLKYSYETKDDLCMVCDDNYGFRIF